jgi:hypothetical protein
VSRVKVSRVTVSRVTEGYGIEAGTVYFQREEQIHSDYEQNQQFAMVSAPPSRLEMQLLEITTSNCEFANLRSIGTKLVTKWYRSTGVNLERAVPEIARPI